MVPKTGRNLLNKEKYPFDEHALARQAFPRRRRVEEDNAAAVRQNTQAVKKCIKDRKKANTTEKERAHWSSSSLCEPADYANETIPTVCWEHNRRPVCFIFPRSSEVSFPSSPCYVAPSKTKRLTLSRIPAISARASRKRKIENLSGATGKF